MNLEQVYAWLEGIPPAPTRSSQFEKIAHRKLANCSHQLLEVDTLAAQLARS